MWRADFGGGCCLCWLELWLFRFFVFAVLGFSVVFGVECAFFGDGFCASLFCFALEVGYGWALVYINCYWLSDFFLG